MPWSFRSCFLLAVLGGMSAPAQRAPDAQGPAVRGVVVDRSGAPVAGAAVELDAADGRVLAEATSTAAGEFTMQAPDAGDYVIRVAEVHGLTTRDSTIKVSAHMAALRLVLIPATVAQTVNVGSDAEALTADAAANHDSIAVNAGELDHLPVFDQDIVGALLPFLDASSTSSSGVSLVVDGIEVKSLNVSPSAIAEARINSDPYSAEFASPGRGRLEITTKPGSQQFHGTLNFIARDAVFNARNYFAPSKPAEQRRIYEGHITGPLGRGKHTNFLITGTRQEDDLDAAVHAVTDAGLVEENAPQPARNSQITGRVTHDYSPNQRLAVGYNFRYQTVNNQGVGGIVLPEAGVNFANRQDQLLVNDRIIVSPRLIQQMQILFERETESVASTTDAQSIQVQDSFTGGGAQQGYYRTEDTIGIVDVVSWTRPKHYVRFGVVIPQISRRAYDDHSDRLGIYNFQSLANYAAGAAEKFTIEQGAGRGIYYATEVGTFAQDEMTLRKGLQLTVGVRYQWTTYLTNGGSVAPRVSMAWLPAKGWAVRAGSGVFYDRSGGDFPVTYKLHNGVVLRQYQVINPGYPNALPVGGTFAGTPVSLVREQTPIGAPYQIQYSAGVERKLGKAMTVTATYRGATGVKTFRSRDANAPLPPYTSTLAVPDPAVGFIQQVEAGGRMRLNAMDLGFSGRAGQWFQGQAQYTWSYAYNNAGGLNWYPQNQYEPNAEWGRADTDRRQKFNLLGSIHPGHWLTLGVATAITTGAPYSELAGQDLYLTGLPNARPAGVSRNTLQGATTASVDVLWDHDFHLGKADKGRVLNVGVSAFNVLNHANFSSYVGNLQSPLFEQPTVAAAGRQMQFGARYQF